MHLSLFECLGAQDAYHRALLTSTGNYYQKTSRCPVSGIRYPLQNVWRPAMATSVVLLLVEIRRTAFEGSRAQMCSEWISEDDAGTQESNPSLFMAFRSIASSLHTQ
jgi:hypothetical protein